MDIFLAELEKYKILIDLVFAVCSFTTTVLLIVQTSKISKRQDKISLYNTREEYYDLICEIESCVSSIKLYMNHIEESLKNIEDFYNIREEWYKMLDKNKDLEKVIRIYNSVSEVQLLQLRISCVVLKSRLVVINMTYQNEETKNNGCFNEEIEEIKKDCIDIKNKIKDIKSEMLKELSLTK